VPIDPTELAKRIGASAPWTPNAAWPRPCSRSPRRPSSCSPPMGRAHAGRRQRPAALGRASDQTAQTIENGQERLAQGPRAVAFSQRLPAAIHNIHIESDWQEFTQVLLGEGICAALSVPVELDGGVLGTLDISAAEPRDWEPSEVAALQADGGLVASLLSAATTRSRGGWPISCRLPWSIVG
jgi:GAF domain-containing protein